MTFEESKRKYMDAVDKAKEKRLREAFELYTEALIDRINSRRKEEEEFILFYRYQLAKYLGLKKKYLISLAEGDMVSDLIVKSYDEFMEEVEESVIRISEEGRRNLLVELKIEYPVWSEGEEKEEILLASN